ncbi:MAG: hypothetical protein OIF47_10280 [Marinibacterium sp.]|nr:hypothetical protein [Marinibacterium sp.]
MTTALDLGSEFFLSETQQVKLAEFLDKKINLPFIRNQNEPAIFLKAVRAMDRTIRQYTPDEILRASQAPDLQIEDIIAQALKDNLVPLLSDLLRIPMLPREIRDRAVELAVDVIVSALAGLTTIDETIEEFLAQT